MYHDAQQECRHEPAHQDLIPAWSARSKGILNGVEDVRKTWAVEIEAVAGCKAEELFTFFFDVCQGIM